MLLASERVGISEAVQLPRRFSAARSVALPFLPAMTLARSSGWGSRWRRR